MKRILLIIVVAVVLLAAILPGCSSADGQEYIELVQNGYLGEYTDVTVKELFSWKFSKDYDEEYWKAGLTDDGDVAVQLTFHESANLFPDITIQFNIIDEKAFKIQSFNNPSHRMKDIMEFLSFVNNIYYEWYLNSYPEISRDSLSLNIFLEKLDSISGSAVQYGAAMDYSGDRAGLCTLVGDEALEVSVPYVLDAYDYIDLEKILLGTSQPDESMDTSSSPSTAAPENSKVEEKTYATVKDFLDEPEVQVALDQMVEDIMGQDDTMSVSIDGGDNVLIYTFTFTDEALEGVYVPDLCVALEEELNSASATYEDIAASLYSVVEAENVRVTVVYAKYDGTVLVSREFEPNK